MSGDVDVAAMKARIHETVARYRDNVVELSRGIHAKPELGLHEFETSALIARTVAATTGVTPEFAFAALPTAFRAEAGTGELTVTLCAEYDALPGLGHACGHNIIAASAFGAFVVLAQLADELGITVRLLGTPAEENAGGKVTLLDHGAFDGTHAVLMVHPDSEDVAEIESFAAQFVDVEFHGREAHASSTPFEGVNALDAMTIMLTAIGLARQQLGPLQQIHGVVREGGTAANVIPARSSGTWLARATGPDPLDQTLDTIRRCAEAGAHATGCAVSVHEGPMRYLNFEFDPAITAAYAANLPATGRASAAPTPRGGSSDIGNVSHRYPTIHPLIGLGDPRAAPHTAEFAALAGSALGDQAAVDGAYLLAATVCDIAGHPAQRQRLLSQTTPPGV